MTDCKFPHHLPEATPETIAHDRRMAGIILGLILAGIMLVCGVILGYEILAHRECKKVCAPGIVRSIGDNGCQCDYRDCR